MELWKPVLNFEGRYEVSNLGRVRSLDHIVRIVRHGVEGTRLVKGRLLKPGSYKSGHVSVAIGKNNSRLVHQLVLESFVGARPENMECLHLNHNPKDNRLANLKYGTRQENIQMDYAANRRRGWGHKAYA